MADLLKHVVGSEKIDRMAVSKLLAESYCAAWVTAN